MSAEKQARKIARVIDEAGGPAELARFINSRYPDAPLTTQAVCDWKRKRIPPFRVLQVEAAVREKGGKTTRHDIAPELYPRERAA